MFLCFHAPSLDLKYGTVMLMVKSKRYTENSHAHSEVKSRRHTLIENNCAHSEVKF